MRSIVYNGVDLSEWCSAEVIEKVAMPVVPDTMAVPGRAGALLVSGRIPPRLARVRLFMDAGFRPGTNGLADIRHRVYATLYSTAGGTLRLPDEPDLEYRDAVCTDAGVWSSLFEDGQGEVLFTLLDPVAYGRARSETGTSFEVGGSWPTWPTFELTAVAGSAVQVSSGGECDLGDTVAVVDSSRTPEWRLKARVVKRVRTFGDAVICRVTIGTVQQVDYAVTSSLAADVAALQNDVAGIDGNLSVATSVQVVESTVTTAIDDLDELADLDF